MILPPHYRGRTVRTFDFRITSARRFKLKGHDRATRTSSRSFPTGRSGPTLSQLTSVWGFTGVLRDGSTVIRVGRTCRGRHVDRRCSEVRDPRPVVPAVDDSKTCTAKQARWGESCVVGDRRSTPRRPKTLFTGMV